MMGLFLKTIRNNKDFYEYNKINIATYFPYKGKEEQKAEERKELKKEER